MHVCRSLPSVALLSFAATFAFAPAAQSEASLWLFPDSSYPQALTDAYADDEDYVGDSHDPWFTDSYVLTGGDLTLDVFNHGRGKGDRTAYGAKLIVAVNDLDLFATGFFLPEGGPLVFLSANDFVFGAPPLPCSLAPLASHGVFTTAYAEILLGDIAVDQILEIAVSVGGDLDLLVHLDVIATGIRGKRGCIDLHNPFSHDVTIEDPDGGFPTPPAS